MKWENIEQGQSGQLVADKLNAALNYLIVPPVHDTNINYAINGEVDKIILVTTGGHDIIITLPPLSNNTDYEDHIFIIIKVDDGSGRVIINGYDNDQIMGNDTVLISYQWEIYKLLKHSELWIPIF